MAKSKAGENSEEGGGGGMKNVEVAQRSASKLKSNREKGRI